MPSRKLLSKFNSFTHLILCACDLFSRLITPSLQSENPLFTLSIQSLTMTSPSALVSTSISLITSLTTSFSTIYRTSQPIVPTTVTSIVSQLSTYLQTETLTQLEVTMTSTIAIPITTTQTISQLFTSTPTHSLLPPPPASIIIVTSTLTSTLIGPGRTITYYPSPPTLTIPTTITQVTLYPYPPVSTVTFTELDYILANAAGSVYTTLTTILPLSPTPTNGAIFVIDTEEEKHGWNSWSTAAKGGLIAGMVIAGLLILGLIVWCLTRRRKIWLASEWVGPPAGQVVPTQSMGNGNAYWGYGPAGWGIRGGGKDV